MSAGENAMASDVTWMRLSAVLHVDDLMIAELSDGTEFHVECSALGLCGDPFPIEVYDGSSDPQKIAALRELLQVGALLVAENEALDVVGGNSLRMMGPCLKPFSGESSEFLKCLSKRKVC